MKVHNLLVTGSLTSGGEVITSISSSTVTKLGSLSSSLSTSIGGLSSSMASSMTSLSSSLTSSMGSLSSSMASSMTSLSSSLTGSMGSLSSSMVTSMNSLSSSMGSIMATTGSNLFKGDQTISGSIIPAVNSSYDLGSPTNEFRHLYLSSASLYIDGTKVLGSTTQELQITTDTGQSFKILEAGSDTITLQAADGNITLATSGGGDVILDPTSGVIALKGTTTLYAGNKILSSDGNAIQIGNSVTMTGSLIVTGFIETQELRTTYISSSILYRSGSTKFGDELTDTHSFTGSLSVSGSISIPESGLVSGSSQITYSGLSGVPSGIISGSAQLPSGLVSGSSQILNGSGIWSGSAQLPSGVVSGSAQTIANLPSGVVSGSVQTIANLPSGTVSGSVQVSFTGTTGYSTYVNQAVLTSSSPTFAGLTNNGTYTQTTTSTQPVMIYGDSAGSNGLFRIQIDEINDSFGTGARTFLGDGGIDIFLGTSNSSYTPGNTYIALNHGGEISMGAGSATKHLILSTGGTATFSGSVGVGISPLTKLHLQGSSPNYILLTNTAADGVQNAIQGGIIGQSRGYSNNLSQMASILFRNENSDAWYKGEITFNTNGSDGTNPAVSPTERLRIASGGNIGINEAAPSKILTVNFGTSISDGLLVTGTQRQETRFKSTGEHSNVIIDSGHSNIYLPSLAFLRSESSFGEVRLQRASNSDSIGSFAESEMVIGSTTSVPLSIKTNEVRRIRVASGGGVEVFNSLTVSSSITASGNMSARNFSRVIKVWSPAGATGSYTTTSYNWANELAALASNFDDGGFYSGYIRSGNGAHFFGYYFKIVVGSKGYGSNDLQYKIQDLVAAHAPWSGGCGGTAFGTIDTVNFVHRNNPCNEVLELSITKLGG